MQEVNSNDAQGNYPRKTRNDNSFSNYNYHTGILYTIMLVSGQGLVIFRLVYEPVVRRCNNRL